MHYTCRKCNYEFEVNIAPHPHNITSIFQLGPKGCPVCLKASAMSKICPKCGSLDLTQTINEKEKK